MRTGHKLAVASMEWKDRHMTRQLIVLGVAALGVVALEGRAAAPQGSSSQEVQFYAGEMFGDRLTETAISGSTPRINSSITAGGRYTYYFNETLGVQVSAAADPTRVGHVASGNGDFYFTTVDVDTIWNFTPGYKIVGYTVAGLGYAYGILDKDIVGTVGGVPVRITGSNGYTANVGLGAKYYFSTNFFVDVNARYRYLSKLVNKFGQGLNTAETTVGIGYRF
jgi:hypothetical protein